MNSRCKKKPTPICQHLKLPLEQILHVALVQSHSHIGYTHSSKLNRARTGSWIWHVMISTTKQLRQSSASFWPGPTTTFPNDLQQRQYRRACPDRGWRAALRCRQGSARQPRAGCPTPASRSPRDVPRHASSTSTDTTAASHVGDRESSRLGWQIQSRESLINHYRHWTLK